MSNYEGFDYEDFDRNEELKKKARGPKRNVKSTEKGCNYRIKQLFKSWGVIADEDKERYERWSEDEQNKKERGIHIQPREYKFL